jgi:lysophospholipase L1-like esterase
MTSEPSYEALRRAARPHDGLQGLLTAFGVAALGVGLTYVVPGLAELRPWLPGDPPPVVSKLLPSAAPRVVETESGELVAAEPVPAEPALASVPTVPVAPPAPSAVDPATLPARPPGVATALVDAEHKGMAPFYAALHRARLGRGKARASHWGDSTIAADGISGTVRSRLQARFGDGGPGFLPAGMDPRWNSRPDVAVTREGEWDTKSMLLGGAEGGRYGFAGIVATAPADGSVSFLAPKKGETRTPQHRAEVWYQVGPGAGSWSGAAGSKGVGGGSAAAEAAADRFAVKDVPDGFTRLTLKATEGPVTFYGVVMETKGPGVVWDALGVVGVGSHSFNHAGRKHLAAQVGRRKPDLVVVQLGGNELGMPALSKDGGAGYVPYFSAAFDKIRAGAPEAGCLIVTPLDQGTRKGGQAGTKPLLATLVAQQRAIAAAKGCAFWDAWAAMGGKDSIVAWSRRKPPLAWTDLLHLSTDGQAIIGNLLADAIEAGYDLWVKQGNAAPVEAAVLAEKASAPAASPSASPTTTGAAARKPSGTKKDTPKSGTKKSGSSKKPGAPKKSASAGPDAGAEGVPSATPPPAGGGSGAPARGKRARGSVAPAPAGGDAP